MTLAIKPTRREVIKAVIAKHSGNKKAEAKRLDQESARLRDEGRAEDAKIYKVASDYANKKNAKLLSKLKKIVHEEFPEAQVYFTVDLEKTTNINSRFKPNGKANVRLVVLDANKRELGLPDEVRQAMVAADERANALFQEAEIVYRQAQKLYTASAVLDQGRNAGFQDVLDTAIFKLGESANPHLDALIDLLHKALTVEVAPDAK